MAVAERFAQGIGYGVQGKGPKGTKNFIIKIGFIPDTLSQTMR